DNKGWGFNKSEIGEVFTKAQMYQHKVPGQTEVQLNKLEPTHYDLPTNESVTKDVQTELPQFENNVTEWLEALEAIKNVKTIRHWQRRPIAIHVTFFNKIIATKENKGKLITALQGALSNPDEVWINGKGLGDMVYVKY